MSEPGLFARELCLADPSGRSVPEGQVDFREILHRREFSGALSLDEFMPRRDGRYEQIAGDAKTLRILYLEPVPEFYGRGATASPQAL